MKKEFDIKKKEDGYNADVNGKTIFLPTAELLNIGCKNCVWRLNSQCPHDLKEGFLFTEVIDGEGKLLGANHSNKSTPALKGICNEMIQFVLSLAGPDDTSSALWEKYHIYKARLQESDDYQDFKKLEKQIREAEKNIATDEDKIKLENLRMNKTSARMWWIRLNEHVVKSLQKVVDREQKASAEGKIPGILSAKTINFNITKKVEDKTKEGDKDGGS